MGPPPTWDPLRDYEERARQRAERQEHLESSNLGSSHQSLPSPFPCPGTRVLGPNDPSKSPAVLWRRPRSILLTPSLGPGEDRAKFSPKRILSESCSEGLGRVSSPRESWLGFITLRQLAAQMSGGSRARESLGLIRNPPPLY